MRSKTARWHTHDQAGGCRPSRCQSSTYLGATSSLGAIGHDARTGAGTAATAGAKASGCTTGSGYLPWTVPRPTVARMLMEPAGRDLSVGRERTTRDQPLAPDKRHPADFTCKPRSAMPRQPRGT